MKKYRVYKTVELRATVEAEDEFEARQLAYNLVYDMEHVEVEVEDWGTIS